MTTETESRITEDLEGAMADVKAVQDYADEMRSTDDRQRRLLAHAAMTTIERVQRNLDALHGEFWSIQGGDDEAAEEGEQDIIAIDVPAVEYNDDDPLHRAAMALHSDRTDSLSAAMLILSEARDVLDVMHDMEGPAPWAMVKDVRGRVYEALKRLDAQEQADRDVYLAFAETQR